MEPLMAVHIMQYFYLNATRISTNNYKFIQKYCTLNSEQHAHLRIWCSIFYLSSYTFAVDPCDSLKAQNLSHDTGVP